MKETWLKIKGYEEYEVSDLGNIRSLNYNRTGETKLLKPGTQNKGYLFVILYKNGKSKKFLVHGLVITTFRGPIPPGMQVNHINEDKSDNRLSNLEVVTAKQNINHGTRNERVALALLGNSNGKKQLQLTNARTSAKYTFSCSCEASVFFGYKSQTRIGSYISQARKRGKTWIKIRGEKHYFSQSA